MTVERMKREEHDLLRATPPDQVKRVRKALEAHVEKVIEMDLEQSGATGEEAEETRTYWRNRVYTGLDEYRTDRGLRWIVGDDYEREMLFIYYPDLDEWCGMYPYGDEFPKDGGLDGALAGCEIYFTG